MQYVSIGGYQEPDDSGDFHRLHDRGWIFIRCQDAPQFGGRAPERDTMDFDAIGLKFCRHGD